MAKYFINTQNGSGLEYNDFKKFIQELKAMHSDFLRHGGTEFAVSVDADAECFLTEDEYENEIRPIKYRIYNQHDGGPLRWNDEELEFDTQESALLFLATVPWEELGLDNEYVIEPVENNSFYISYLNATGCICVPNGDDVMLVNKETGEVIRDV